MSHDTFQSLLWFTLYIAEQFDINFCAHSNVKRVYTFFALKDSTQSYSVKLMYDFQSVLKLQRSDLFMCFDTILLAK
jgi:hypothetical protein